MNTYHIHERKGNKRKGLRINSMRFSHKADDDCMLDFQKQDISIIIKLRKDI